MHPTNPCRHSGFREAIQGIRRKGLMTAIIGFPLLGTFTGYKQLQFEFDRELKILYSWMKPESRPCFNPGLVQEITRAESEIESQQGWISHSGRAERLQYAVFGSKFPGV